MMQLIFIWIIGFFLTLFIFREPIIKHYCMALNDLNPAMKTDIIWLF